MASHVTYLDPAGDVLAQLPSPFAAPVAVARRAAADLLTRLRAGGLGVDLEALDRPGGGKMFGALVVQGPRGVGYLAAFSGMLGGRWQVPGFAPPLFDPVARDAFWPAGEAELAAIDAALADDGEAVALRAELDALLRGHEAATASLRVTHLRRKTERAAARAALVEPGARHALDQASRADTAERRRLDAAHREAHDLLAPRLRVLDDARAALEAHRAARSRHYLARIHDTYVIASARGERRSLRDLFAPGEPPGGAGDCAAPKLIGHAHALGVVPLALAEVWYGAPPATGDRRAGSFYPACRGKCGAILPFMLDGLAVDDAPVFGNAAIAADEPRVVFEDAWLIVVDKPVGLLSVPGRHAQLRDSVQVRLRRLHPQLALVHRLDLDTSGLLLAAKDAETHAALQRQFARREIDKRYLAWLDGDVAGDAGVIELALRVDLDDRPRQIHDPVHGKAAVTAWRVLERTGGRTRVVLSPHTGRTHQLRVHAAHPLGLGAPVVGDRLYGHDGARLLLHAEALAFAHPRTGQRVELERPAPF